MNCTHSGCGACCGGRCGKKVLELTEKEAGVLARLREIAYLPVMRDTSGALVSEEDVPVDALSSLADKRLVTIDDDQPLLNYDYSDLKGARTGSAALTALGLEAAEQLPT